MRLHLDSALYIVSAWNGEELIGYARLEGNRLSVEISDVLVKSEYQGKGTGTQLVDKLVSYIIKLNPYSIQVSPVGEREIHIYEKFGFTKIPEYVKMEIIIQKLVDKISKVRNNSVIEKY